VIEEAQETPEANSISLFLSFVEETKENKKREKSSEFISFEIYFQSSSLPSQGTFALFVPSKVR
jgi:hypothetical protein